MKKAQIIYLLFMTAVFAACETLYDANLDDVDSVIVIDARVAVGVPDNTITISKSVGFNDKSIFQAIDNAEVQIIDDNNNTFECHTVGDGNYQPDFQIDSERMYKLKVVYGGQTYESEFEPVPEKPFIDSLYIEDLTKIVKAEGDALEEFYSIPGKQTFIDISGNTEPTYYRFYGKKVLQYIYPTIAIINGIAQEVTAFAWKTILPDGSFDVAGPVDYSFGYDIKRHELEFFNDGAHLINPEYFVYGWIYVMDQYSITESSFKFYQDLNSQLGSSGKIFDPMYVQARSNIKCTSDPNKIVLGNFEIANHTQYRYFMRFDKVNNIFKKIDEFYDIPIEGVSAEGEGPPEFWVSGD